MHVPENVSKDREQIQNIYLRKPTNTWYSESASSHGNVGPAVDLSFQIRNDGSSPDRHAPKFKVLLHLFTNYRAIVPYQWGNSSVLLSGICLPMMENSFCGSVPEMHWILYFLFLFNSYFSLYIKSFIQFYLSFVCSITKKS